MFFACDNCDTVDSTDLTPNAITMNGYMCACCCPDSTGWHGMLPKTKYDPVQHVVINRPAGDDDMTISLD